VVYDRQADGTVAIGTGPKEIPPRILRHDLRRPPGPQTLPRRRRRGHVQAVRRLPRNDAGAIPVFEERGHRVSVFDGTGHDGDHVLRGRYGGQFDYGGADMGVKRRVGGIDGGGGVSRRGFAVVTVSAFAIVHGEPTVEDDPNAHVCVFQMPFIV